MTTDKRAELEAEIRRSLQVYRGWTSDSDAAVNLESSVKGILKLADQYTTTVAEEAERRGETSALEMQKLWAELHGFTGETLYSGICHVLDSTQQFPDQPLASHALEQLTKSKEVNQ